MECAPIVPESAVVGAGIQEAGDLIRMKCDRIAAQQMPQKVQSGVPQRVGQSQDVEVQIRHAQPAATAPELFRSWRRQSLHAVVPEAEVQLDGQRNIHIEKITAPFPSCLADQRWQMIGGEAFHPGNPLIAQVAESRFRRVNALWR